MVAFRALKNRGKPQHTHSQCHEPDNTPPIPRLPAAPHNRRMQLQTARFEALGKAFFTHLKPTPLPAPYWVGRSNVLADQLNLSPAWLQSNDALHSLTGNLVTSGSTPLASVYSGHQFGQWAGQLGDGRALLLGDIPSAQGLLEVQLKGSGLTPYSRMGDGRAVLRSSIREFLCSEAMHALGIPSTRALAVTGSEAPVQRETLETAAVLTRVAPSFIRFGHFEHFSYSGQHNELRALADFVIEHFYPECHDGGHPYARFLQAVTERTAELLAQWQAVGFCHGVMNTDNMSILGLTLDYGPFQFMDAFNPGHICNHTDRTGRYAYARQPNVAYWNLFCLGQALLPLLDNTQQALEALEPYKSLFPAALQRRMNAKLGLTAPQSGDAELTEDLLQLLAADRVDHTLFWRRLSHVASDMHLQTVRDLFLQRDAFDAWATRWRHRLDSEHPTASPSAHMLSVNPQVVLRNHLGEIAIRHAQQGDHSALERLHNALSHPFDALPGHEDLADFPPDWAAHIEISCSS
jgi:serine/tyrosine/threonine adenylyltransferase